MDILASSSVMGELVGHPPVQKYPCIKKTNDINDMSTNNPVVKVEGRRSETLTTGLFVLSIPGMAT